MSVAAERSVASWPPNPQEWPADQPVIKVDRLWHSYGPESRINAVLKGVSLEMMAGEVVIMKGPSGCGKTTILTLIGALRSIRDGSVTIFGKELKGLGPAGLVAVRRAIGFIFQRHNLFESLTSTENVELALELRDPKPPDSAERALQALNQVNLGPWAKAHPERLSGGQRQRVAIARALVNNPPLILADEPTAAVDPPSKAKVVDELKRRAAQERVSVLIVTHDTEVMNKGDRIIQFKDGEIIKNYNKGELEALGKACLEQKQPTVFKTFTPLHLAGLEEIRIFKEWFPFDHEVVKRGEVGDTFYLIGRGAVEVDPGPGTSKTTLNRGQVFGEVALLRADRKRTATVRVTSPEGLETFTMDRAALHAAMEASPSFAQEIQSLPWQQAIREEL